LFSLIDNRKGSCQAFVGDIFQSAKNRFITDKIAKKRFAHVTAPEICYAFRGRAMILRCTGRDETIGIDLGYACGVLSCSSLPQESAHISSAQ